MAKEKVYDIRVTTTINVDNDTLKKFKELCKRDDISISQRVNEFMKEEVKKVEGITTPIAIAYHRTSNLQSNMRQTSLSAFAHYSKNDIEQDVINTEDRKLLIVYEAHGHTLKNSARKRLHDLELMARVNR
jgi:hypothetical protein